ncbi:MAG: hypothetical protein ACE5K4_09345 [Candidatus Hydrothermarchaeota archaeon]
MDYSEILSIIGLFFDFLGAVILMFPLFESKEKIKELVSSTDYKPIFEEDKARLKESLLEEINIGIIGLTFIFSGFLLQIIAKFY